MKTVLVTTCWLDLKEYKDKTIKWIEYYQNNIIYDLNYNATILLDNASTFKNLELIHGLPFKVMPQRFTEHLTRTSHLEYPYLWRAVDFYKELFKEFDKIIYMDNDFYIISEKLVNHINSLDSSTWWSPYCNKHGFPETGIQVITKDYKPYNDGFPFMKNNGKCMETTLPVVSEKIWNGDRHSESGITIQQPGWDFSAQVPLNMDIEFNK